MAAKKKTSPIVKASATRSTPAQQARNKQTIASRKPASQDKPGPWDNIGRGLSTAAKVGYEVSGAGDVSRFARNPSWKNARNLGITVAAYAAGPVAKAALASRAAKAGFAAEKAVLATRAAKVAEPVGEKSLTFLKGAGSLTTKSGKKLAVSGMEKATTAKNINRVQAGRAAAVNMAADKAGKATVKAVTKKGAKKVVAGYGAGVAVAGAKGGAAAESKRKGTTKRK